MHVEILAGHEATVLRFCAQHLVHGHRLENLARRASGPIPPLPPPVVWPRRPPPPPTAQPSPLPTPAQSDWEDEEPTFTKLFSTAPAQPPPPTSLLSRIFSSQSLSSHPLKGAPLNTPMESDSDDYSDLDSDDQPLTIPSRPQPRAPPTPKRTLVQTPSTTRRAMLGNELSTSLRENLIWERQNRKRAMGLFDARPSPPPKGRNTSFSTSASTVINSPNSLGLPSTSSYVRPLVRRHTEGFGLNLRSGRLSEGDDEGDGDNDPANSLPRERTGSTLRRDGSTFGGQGETSKFGGDHFSHLHSHGW